MEIILQQFKKSKIDVKQKENINKTDDEYRLEENEQLEIKSNSKKKKIYHIKKEENIEKKNHQMILRKN